jgi:SsrA-binding protein
MAHPAKRKAEGPATILNRKARHEYEIINTYEAGVALEGAEVKSILVGQASLAGAYCRVEGGEIWLFDMDVAPYEKSSHYAPDRRRRRKLLMHKREIELIRRRSEERGLALIPTKAYFRNGKVKVELAIAKGKKIYDKREKLETKAARREARNT